MHLARDDARWLAAAARLAGRARPLSRPNPAVGALLVKNGIVIGRGWTQAGGRPHAEAAALSGLNGTANGAANGATLYVSLEPCAHQSGRGPSCADLIIAARPAAVVIGTADPDPRTAGKGAQRIADAGIEVRHADSAPCRASLSGYLAQKTLGRPHVTLKIASSLDGCIALADGTSQWITGAEARAHVHSRRAQADAILVGGGTWRSDQPRLDVRLPGLEQRSPQRFVLTRGTAPEGTIAVASPGDINTLQAIQYLYVEGGAQTAAAFLAADLVDRIELYRAPIVIGSGMAALGDIGLADLASAHGRWHLTEQRQLGSDIFTTYDRVP